MHNRVIYEKIIRGEDCTSGDRSVEGGPGENGIVIEIILRLLVPVA